MKKLITIAVAAMLIGALTAKGRVIYENDFSTRTSEGAISTANWYEMSYHVGQLASSYDKIWESDNIPYVDPDKIQDGWALANLQTNNANYVRAASWVATNSVEQVPEGDSKNQFYKVHGTVTARSNMATHPIGNEFTNGVLRISADMRAPAVWPSNDSHARVMPLYKSQMNSLDWGGSYETPAAFGMQCRNSDSKTTPFLLSGDGTDSGSPDGNHLDGTHVGRHWHRFVMDVDLDTKLVSCSVYKLGLENPTPETQGTLVASVSNKQFRRPLTAERGAISGIGLLTYRTFAESTAVTNSACFDNLSIAWKAPGASDFQLCYENDFTTRRYRTLCPAGTTSAAYPPATDSSIVSDDYLGYYAGQKVVPDCDTSLRNKQPQPQGVDNWRRINDDSIGNATLIESSTSDLAAFGRILRMTRKDSFVCVSQPLGEEISTGKVRLSVDMRLPDKWHWSVSRSAAATLATTAFASTMKSNFSSVGKVGNVGVRASTAETDECKFYPFYNDGSTQTQTDINCVSQNWYRIIQTADMDASTYNFELYHLTTNGVIDGAVYAVTNAAFSMEVPAIGSFALLAYGAGDNTAQSILFDNIGVWKNCGTDDELQIYYNDFTSRRRQFEDARRNLAPNIDRPGVDSWTRRDNGLAAAFVRPLANPALSIVGADDHACLFHSLGTTVKYGRTMLFSIDMRPPSKWGRDSMRRVCVLLGDDSFYQGNLSSADPFESHCSAQFGFASKDAEIRDYGMFMDTVSMVATNGVVIRGAQVDPSHWYRFRVVAKVGSPTYSVRLYDMGTSHPETSTPDGTLVESFDNLAYGNGGPAKGLSSFALGGYGVPGFEPWNDDDPTGAFYDNIRAEVVPSGVMLIVW